MITLELSDEDYLLIPKDVRDRMNIKVIEPKDFDYSTDEIWRGLKKISNKAYKDLKKREYEIRQNGLQ